jgi:hypothetical protein
MTPTTLLLGIKAILNPEVGLAGEADFIRLEFWQDYVCSN